MDTGPDVLTSAQSMVLLCKIVLGVVVIGGCAWGLGYLLLCMLDEDL